MTDRRKSNVGINRRQFLNAAGGAALLSAAPKFRAATADPLTNLILPGADWGVWIDNGLVDPGEAVRMTITVPLNTPRSHLPAKLDVHQRYLEDAQPRVETVALRWAKSLEKNLWVAPASYRPSEAGNYYAAIRFYGHEIFSYFAAWKPGITAINFWVQMPAEYHTSGNLKDLYLPEIRLGHLPFDYELGLVGLLVFEAGWPPRERFRRAQVEAGAEVVPFFDGGYFFKLDPHFTQQFEEVTAKLPKEARHYVSQKSLAFHDTKLPDPTFDSLSVEQCSAVIAGARRYWKKWGFRPFTGVATYSPSDTLVESCRRNALTWISAVFADYDFTDGTDRWEVGWVQKHHGMPSFPYLISKVDFRCAGKADGQGTMMFPGWQNLPVWDHENRHEHGTDPGFYRRYSGLSPVQRMILYSKVFERDNELANNSFPLAATFCIQMDNPDNHALLRDLINRSRQGNLIFVHKRYLQTYFREHHIDISPNVTYTIPDHQFAAGAPKKLPAPYTFSDEAVWEGADGKAAFISNPTAPLEKGRSIHLPVWWYDYRTVRPMSPNKNLPAVDLTGVSLEVEGTSLVIQSPRGIDGLPICLWSLDTGTRSAAWIRKNRALRTAAPERLGQKTVMWILRPTVQAGRTVIPLNE